MKAPNDRPPLSPGLMKYLMGEFNKTEKGKQFMKQKYRTRCLGGSLLVIKEINDCVTIERGNDGRPHIVSVEGDWDQDELRVAMNKWHGSDAERR